MALPHTQGCQRKYSTGDILILKSLVANLQFKFNPVSCVILCLDIFIVLFFMCLLNLATFLHIHPGGHYNGSDSVPTKEVSRSNVTRGGKSNVHACSRACVGGGMAASTALECWRHTPRRAGYLQTGVHSSYSN